MLWVLLGEGRGGSRRLHAGRRDAERNKKINRERKIITLGKCVTYVLELREFDIYVFSQPQMCRNLDNKYQLHHTSNASMLLATVTSRWL